MVQRWGNWLSALDFAMSLSRNVLTFLYPIPYRAKGCYNRNYPVLLSFHVATVIFISHICRRTTNEVEGIPKCDLLCTTKTLNAARVQPIIGWLVMKLDRQVRNGEYCQGAWRAVVVEKRQITGDFLPGRSIVLWST